MSIESELDWVGLREVGRITSRVLDLLVGLARPGITTGDLDAAAGDLVRTEGAQSAPALEYGFPRTVLISVNHEVVHGIPCARVLREGDGVSFDVTLTKGGYVADAARTVMVGAGTREAVRLITCATTSLEAALRVVRPGVPVNAIGRAVSGVVRQQGFGVVQGLVGHGVGRSIHEAPRVPNECDRWQRDVLTNGLVLTIEPMISAGATRVVMDPDGWTLRTRDGSLSAHVEHTLVVTHAGPVILAA